MSKSRGGRDYEQLKAYWYQKLKESGFEDVENDRGFLKDWHSTRFTKDYTTERFTEKQAYFRLASQLLHEHSFHSDHERKVWQLHSEGLSLREIVEEFKDSKLCVNKDNVQKITQKYGNYIRRQILDDSKD